MDKAERDALASVYVAGLLEKSPECDAGTLDSMAADGLIDQSRTRLTEKGRARISVTLSGGVYDMIHPGHIHTLRQASGLGDVLIVVVATEVTALKMKKRKPLHTQEQRRTLVGSLAMVDACIVGNEHDIFGTVKRVSPDVIALGYDQTHQEATIREGCKEVGVEARIVRLVADDEYISSRTIEKIYGDQIHGI